VGESQAVLNPPHPLMEEGVLTPTSVAWYAACTYPRHEKLVARQLQERHIESFLPLYRDVRRWKDRRKELEMVLFPGYVFTRLDLRDRLRVLQLQGITRFVCFYGKPAPLPEQEIEALRRGLSQGIYAKSHPYLKVGRRVRVVHGPLTGAQGILIRTKERCRVVISMDAIQQSVALEVDATDVMPL
jgi:transcription antitermination factor NusG